MSEKGDMNLIDSCVQCRAIKWAGFSELCPRCKAEREWSKPADDTIRLTRPKEKK